MFGIELKMKRVAFRVSLMPEVICLILNNNL